MTRPANPQSLEVLTLGLQDELFAVEASRVREILDLVSITEVPGAPSFLSGLINVRGKVVPLADLKLRFGMAPTEPTIDTRIVVIEIELDGDPVVVGVLADKVYEVTSIAAASIEATPRIGMRWRPEFIRCIGKYNDEFVIVPELGRVFSSRPSPGPAGQAGEPVRPLHS